MKIAVSGKGGLGKTFIAGSLAAYYARHGHSIIAIDTDPSPNLAITLGLSPEEAARIVPIAEDERLIRLKTLMVMGTVRSMGAGCTCPANSLVKALMRHLVVERDEVVILDMEAGIEHLGRGIAEHVDILLVIADANRKSLEIAATICRLAANSAIKNVFLVGNRIADSRQEMAVRTFADSNGIVVLAMIPFDPLVADAGITGNPLEEDVSPALQAIGGLVETISVMSPI